MKQSFTLRMAAMIGIMLFSLAAWAQVTTSTITGSIQSGAGEDLPGATVVAVHEPSGSKYGTTATTDGRFTLPNLRVGGPYTVTISMTGFESQKFEGIQLSLGQKMALNASLKESATALGEIVISGNSDDVLNNQRTGAANNIRREQIATLPTINRSAADYTRLSPASDGNSFAGRNDQYNNFSLDGTIFNNPFGLDAATPGGQSEAQPVSLDAIDQIQIAYAPYDVSQSGFTGAAINAVTKSGTNETKGTVFGFFRNQSMVGSKVDGVDAPKGDLTQFQTGFSLGGALVKNKLFYFVNTEIERRSDLGSSYLANRGASGPGISRVLASDLDAVRAALNGIGYETGEYENFTLEAPNLKGIAKLDWNLSANHKLTLTYNWLDASKEKPAHPSAIGRRGPDATTLQFRNSGYRINNKLNSFLVEAKSVFGAKISNKFQAGYTTFRDSRDPFSTPAPSISIQKGGTRYIIAGHEPFSIFNRLNQDVLQLNDNLSVYLGKHTLTVGAAFEKFSFENCFNLGVYGGTFAPDYASVQAFLDAVAAGSVKAEMDAAQSLYDANTKDESNWNWSYTNLGQVSAYLQDEIAVSDNFTLTLGLRMDKPLYFDTKELIETKLDNPAQACCYQPDIEYYDENGEAIKFDHTTLPSAKPLFNPRLGFNYDMKGDGSMQLRGGTGLFSGRFPFVWVGNQVANPNWWFYCVTHPDFQWPQVWRSNLGYDHKLGNGFTASLDVLHTRDLNGMMVRNYALNTPTNRLNAPGDTRPIYDSAKKSQALAAVLDDGTKIYVPTNAYVFTNTNVGQSTNVMLQLQRTWSNGMSASLGYNYLKATDASSIEAEISSDAYDRNPAYGNVNEAVAGPSIYGNKHRVVGSFSKKITYGGANGDQMGTTIGLFFQYAQGGRFSYTYSGDLNNDGSANNDLIYIPTDADIAAMQFDNSNGDAEAQRTAFKNFVSQDAYMTEHRGEVAEKYGILSPWYNNWDLRVLQDLNLKIGSRKNTLQLSLDILNVGNLVNNGWGVRQIPTTGQPLGVSVDAATGVPTFKFDSAITETFVQDFSLLSRWQMQVGIRYIF